MAGGQNMTLHRYESRETPPEIRPHDNIAS